MTAKRNRFVIFALGANLLFWVYFWLSFALEAQPFDPVEGLHSSVSPVTVFGYAIGVLQQIMGYLFVQLAILIQLPSYLLISLLKKILFPQVTMDWAIAGTDIGGFTLLALTVVSFGQWYVIAKLLAWIRQKFSKR